MNEVGPAPCLPWLHVSDAFPMQGAVPWRSRTPRLLVVLPVLLFAAAGCGDGDTGRSQEAILSFVSLEPTIFFKDGPETGGKTRQIAHLVVSNSHIRAGSIEVTGFHNGHANKLMGDEALWRSLYFAGERVQREQGISVVSALLHDVGDRTLSCNPFTAPASATFSSVPTPCITPSRRFSI